MLTSLYICDILIDSKGHNKNPLQNNYNKQIKKSQTQINTQNQTGGKQDV